MYFKQNLKNSGVRTVILSPLGTLCHLLFEIYFIVQILQTGKLPIIDSLLVVLGFDSPGSLLTASLSFNPLHHTMSLGITDGEGVIPLDQSLTANKW